MVFCHFELHLNVATSLNGIQYIGYKEKLQKVSEKNPTTTYEAKHMPCCHSAQTQEAFPMETNLFKGLLPAPRRTGEHHSLAPCPRKPYPQVEELTDIRRYIPETSNKLTPKTVVRYFSLSKTPWSDCDYVHLPCDTQAFRTCSSSLLTPHLFLVRLGHQRSQSLKDA